MPIVLTLAPNVIPCLGVHPWYSHLFSTDSNDKKEHYNSVFQAKDPIPDDFLASLPDPQNYEDYFADLRRKLNEAKSKGPVMVGEIGIDKLFRVPWSGFFGKLAERLGLSPFKVSMQHQQRLFWKQLDIAAQCQVPISVHCVKAHGGLYDLIIGFLKQKRGLIPSICLHSYTGSVDQAKMWLSKKTKNTLGNTKVFFSFSNVINTPSDEKSQCSFEELIELLPQDSILIETDYPITMFYGEKKEKSHEDELRGILKAICAIKGWSLEEGESILYDNWTSFTRTLET